MSAHRMPDDMIRYGRTAAERGLRVIIAGAGGAAHLPGMLASVTVLPVIGVPVPLKHLDGMDSLLSIVQMPAGIPVATVSIGGARNAGLLAARILAAGTDDAARAAARPAGDLRRRAARTWPSRRAGDCASATPESFASLTSRVARWRSQRLLAQPPFAAARPSAQVGSAAMSLRWCMPGQEISATPA